MKKITVLFIAVFTLFFTAQILAQVTSTLDDDQLLFDDPLLPSSTYYGYNSLNITGGGESSTFITPASLSMFYQSGENISMSPLGLQVTGTVSSFNDSDSELTHNSLTFHSFETLNSLNQRFTIFANPNPRQLHIGYNYDSPGGGVGFGNFMTFDATNNNIGLFLFPGDSPTADLHIKQSSGTTRGVRLEENASTDSWTTYIDGTKDYNFAYNNVLKAYIQDTDGAYVQSSDKRLKKEIAPIGNVLDKVLLLKPSSYYYNDNLNLGKKSWGFIAQEVEAIFPEIVSEKDGFKGLAYDNFAILAIQSIQELNTELEQQKALIESLQTQLAGNEDLAILLKKMESKLTSLEQMEDKIIQLEKQLENCAKE